jgi:copper chaperone CopZ
MNMEKIAEIKITGMTCEGCASRVERMLRREAGVVAAEVSLKRGTAVVCFDSSQTTIEEILNSRIFNRNLQIRGSNGLTGTHRYNAVLSRKSEQGGLASAASLEQACSRRMAK